MYTKKYSKNSSGTGSFADRKPKKPTILHKTTCAKCGDSCEVPFKPNGNRPIHCRACFQTEDKKPKKTTPRDFSEQSFGDKKSHYSEKSTMTTEQFKILNAELDKILDLL